MTDYEKYIAALDKLKADTEDALIAHIGTIEEQAYQALLDWIDNTLDTKNGQLVASAETIKLLNSFSNSYLTTLQEMASYEGAVSAYVKNLKPIGVLIDEFQSSYNDIDLAKAGIGEVQKLVVNQIIDAFTENGLNANFVQPVRNLLYQNISAGTRLQDAKAYMKQYIVSTGDNDGKLKRYLNLTAQQGVDSYTGMINKKLMDSFNYTGIIMSGSIIKTSSPQCRYGINELNGFITKENWDNDLKPIAEDHGLIDGTTFKNLPFNKLHFGCRHEFTPMMLEDGDVISGNKIFNNGSIETKN